MLISDSYFAITTVSTLSDLKPKPQPASFDPKPRHNITRSMKTFGLLVVMAAAFAVAYPIATSAQLSWYPIGDPMNEPHVQELGAWAVAEHVKQVHDGIKFSKVVSGEEQSDAGVKYHLIIEALNSGGKQGRYEAILIEEVRSYTRTLISFSPAK
jgi:hypothetical protein